jgi:ABC-2 type transport system ATP-binding protein
MPPEDTDDSMLVVDDLTKRYGDTVALDGVSLSAREGEVVGLLGPNGAGKTTLMKAVTGLTVPTAGTVRVDGVDVTDDPDAVKRRIGYIPQETALDDWLTGRQVLRMFAAFYKIPAGERDERIEAALARVDLVDAADVEVGDYSGGMQRRLEIAAGLLHEPALVVFDEPTLGVDPVVRRELWTYVQRLREAGGTVLLSTHYLEEAAQLCDRVAVLREGRVGAVGAPADLWDEASRTADDAVFADLAEGASPAEVST